MNRSLVLLAILSSVLLSSATVAVASPGDAIARAFGAMEEDPAPPRLVRDTHYVVSNENSHHLFRDEIANDGGVFVGVGADQVYILAGWSRPEVLVPMDFDAAIRDLHYVYGAAFMSSESREEFLEFMKNAPDEQVEEAVRTYFGDEQVAGSMRIWRHARGTVRARLLRLERYYGSRHPHPTFVTDDATWAFLRELWRNHRVFPMRGDFEGDVAMQEIARAAQASGLKVRTIYLSNVEQYVTYNPAVRRNLLVLPADERSYFLRTRPMRSLGIPEPDDDYHFNMQSLTNLQRWMRSSNVPAGRNMLINYRQQTATPGLSIISAEPSGNASPEIAQPAPGLSLASE